MTNTGYFCDNFQLTGRHDLRWQETTENHEIWKCVDCGCIERDEIEKVAT